MSAFSRSTAASVCGRCELRTLDGKGARTTLIAALLARIFGLGLSALGVRGGRAATCGDEASGDRSFAKGVFAGVTTGGCSPRTGPEGRGGMGAVDEELGEYADIMA